MPLIWGKMGREIFLQRGLDRFSVRGLICPSGMPASLKKWQFIRSPRQRVANRDSGIVNPSDLAALRLTGRSNLVGCNTGA
jgi:hypothetical protein